MHFIAYTAVAIEPNSGFEVVISTGHINLTEIVSFDPIRNEDGVLTHYSATVKTGVPSKRVRIATEIVEYLTNRDLVKFIGK